MLLAVTRAGQPARFYLHGERREVPEFGVGEASGRRMLLSRR
jgi:hypothetical protein